MKISEKAFTSCLDFAIKALAIIGAGVLAWIICTSFCSKAFAAEGDYLVEYKGKAAGLVSADTDFFAHFPAMVPGDELSGSVTVENGDAVPQKVLFRAEQTGAANRAEAEELLDLMTLTISSDRSGEVYSGTLRAAGLEGGVCLGTFAKGQGDTLRFAVTMPAGLGNEHAMAANSVKWVFLTQEAPDAPGGWLDKTGDDMGKLLALAGCVAVAAGCLIVLIVLKRKKKEEE